jgi:hypothetical protein
MFRLFLWVQHGKSPNNFLYLAPKSDILLIIILCYYYSFIYRNEMLKWIPLLSAPWPSQFSNVLWKARSPKFLFLLSDWNRTRNICALFHSEDDRELNWITLASNAGPRGLTLVNNTNWDLVVFGIQTSFNKPQNSSDKLVNCYWTNRNIILTQVLFQASFRFFSIMVSSQNCSSCELLLYMNMYFAMTRE